MLTAQATGIFKKEAKLCHKRGKPMIKLKEVQDALANEIPLPPSQRDHALKGNWSGSRECHIEPDWLLIYTIQPPFIVFERTGTHSDLFGK